MENLRTLWSKLDNRRRAIVLGATLAMFAAIALLARGPGNGEMALLYAGLDAAAAGEIVAALESRGTPYEVRGDAIWVPESSRDLERVTLAAEGLPAASSQGYELLDSLCRIVEDVFKLIHDLKSNFKVHPFSKDLVF